VVGGDEFLKPRLLAHDVARLGWIVVEVIVGNELVQLGQTLAFFGDKRGEIHKKKNGDRPRGGTITVSATNQLSFLDACGFDRTVAAGEFLDATGGVDELLFAGEEWMAGRADTDLDVPSG